MARVIHRRPFDPEVGLVACRPFTADGVQYKAGDIVQMPVKGPARRRMKILYDMNKVRHIEIKDMKTTQEYVYAKLDDLDNLNDMRVLRRICSELGIKAATSKQETKARIRQERDRRKPQVEEPVENSQEISLEELDELE